ncbi:MAG TPA: AI-2E family transporter [Chitinophagaceae bacterium]|nr:AI-2E family transporter [Chitinophagaceae bacterium]
MLKEYPFYFKCTVILLGLILFVYVITNLRVILVPLSFALLIAILLNPLVCRLQGWKVPRVLAITIALLLAFLFITGVGYFLSAQISGFADQFPLMKKKVIQLIEELQRDISRRFNIDIEKQQQAIEEAGEKIKPLIGSTAGALLSSLAAIILLPVYSFLFLYYKDLLLNFVYEIFSEKNFKEVGVVLKQTKGAIQSYMYGLVLETTIVAVLNSLALLILGVKYWILLGILGAILNIIPYIGGLMSVALPIIIATVTKDGFHTQLLVIICYMVIQFVDNHFLVPYIVSSKVKINALISIVFVLLGNAAWGVSGMFLCIPFAGILKIIFDRIEELKPWGRLLGDEMPTRPRGQWRRLRKPRTALKLVKQEEKKASSS